MAKKIQFWMTDDEYIGIEQNLIAKCNKNGCSPSETFKAIIIENLKGKTPRKMTEEEEFG